MNLLLLLSLMLATLSTIPPAASYQNGAPPTVCDTLKPGHGFDGQTVASPYSIKLSSNQYSPGSEISVTIQAENGAAFKGFLVQARLADDGNSSAVGTFKNYTSGTQALKCFNIDNSAVTHTDPSNKTAVTFTWVSPTDQQKPVEFRYTVVQDVRVYWVMQKSDRIEYTAGNTTVGTTPGVVTTPSVGTTPAVGTTPSVGTTPGGASAGLSSSFWLTLAALTMAALRDW